MSYKGPRRIVLLLKGDGGVASEVLVKEAATGQPQPIEPIQRVIGIQQRRLEVLGPDLPRLPQVAPGEEACDRVPAQMVDPPRAAQLSHRRIDEGESGPPLPPGLDQLRVVVPVNRLSTILVMFNTVPSIDARRIVVVVVVVVIMIVAVVVRIMGH